MARDGLKYWLALTRVRGLERRSEVVEFLKGREAEDLFLGGFSPQAQRAVEGFGDWGWVEREIELVERLDVSVITLCDAVYPRLLKEINDPPYLLYARGDTGAFLSESSVAVVGTRNPTHYGLTMAESISRDLAISGVTVVSGMARGCDSAAHRGALVAGGVTIAVLGTGVDTPYPRGNGKLYDEIVEKGLVVSEFSMGTAPAPYNFPKRNRIISGISLGVVVVEAPLKSGALMTAGLALDYNREVFAVPGPATSSRSRGTNKLIKEGAAAVEDAWDILSALSITPMPRVVDTVGPRGDEGVIYSILDGSALNIDEIVEKTNIPAARALAFLLDLELKGLVGQRPGKCFFRRA